MNAVHLALWGLLAGAPAAPAAPKESAMTLETVHLGTLVVTMGKSVFMEGTPAGSRLVIDFTEITLDGERIHAAKSAGTPAGDWLQLGPGNVATLDIRFQLETQDGASIYVHGLGRADSARFSSGAPCWFTPLFETSDARYAWLNRVQGIARGVASGKVVTFELYEVR